MHLNSTQLQKNEIEDFPDQWTVTHRDILETSSHHDLSRWGHSDMASFFNQAMTCLISSYPISGYCNDISSFNVYNCYLPSKIKICKTNLTLKALYFIVSWILVLDCELVWIWVEILIQNCFCSHKISFSSVYSWFCSYNYLFSSWLPKSYKMGRKIG